MAVVIPIQYNGFSQYNQDTEDPSVHIEDRPVAREESNDGDRGDEEASNNACPINVNMTGVAAADEETPCVSMTTEASCFIDDAIMVYPSDAVFDEADDSMEIDQNDYEVDSDMAINRMSPATSARFGGLYNMGNTCYMNSALQMLASLEEFTADVRSVATPVEESDKLRLALKDLLERLESGESVSPDSFKQSIDERTSLFLGYRQQDSHEFLTTLLDLIDEDYKRKEMDARTELNVPVASRAIPGTEGSDDVMEEVNQISPDESDDNKATEDETEYVSLEKQRPREVDENEGDSKDCRGLGRVSTLVDLQFGDIEHLLHGDRFGIDASSEKFSVAEREREEPKCKLVGGRMNATGVEHTRLEQRPTEVDGAVTDASQEASKAHESDDDSTVPRMAVKSPIESNFTTEVRVCLTCESCKYRRSHTETFLHLSLEIGPGCSSVEDGLRKFFAPEKREIKCEKCFHSSALQTSEITKLPRALLFHLKRFIVDISYDYTSISYRKDQSPVSFEEKIELSQGDVISECLAPEVVVPEGCRYGIRSVVNHIGASASCGHYTADAKRQYSVGEEGREWTRFNDSIVAKISSQSAVENSSRTAYMIMYELER